MVNRLVGGGSAAPKTSRPLNSPFRVQTTAPAGIAAPASVSRPVPINQPAPVPVWDNSVDSGGGGGYSGGGGGGGGSAAAATVAAARPSLQDFISGNFLNKQAIDEGNRRLGEFDADTTRQQGLVAADQALRRTNLQQNLDDQGVQNAETMAARGLLNSGLTFQNQDKINQFGNNQRGVIDQLLSTFQTNRAGQRAQQEAANRAAIQDAISKITDQYAAQYGAASGM